MKLQEQLNSWVEHEIISKDQAEAIRAYEEPGGSTVPRGQVPLVAEALGYLGAALATAALITLLADSWPTLPLGIRLAVPFLAAILLFLAGWALRATPEPAFARFASALWALCVASTGWFMLILAQEALEVTSDNVVGVAVGAACAALAATLFLARRLALQLIALAISAGILVGSAAQIPFDTQGEAWQVGLIIWAASLVWLLLTYKGLLIPQMLAYGLGAYAAITAPQTMTSAEGAPVDLGLVVGLGTAFALIAISVWKRQNVLLVFGAIGAFMYLIRTIEYYFGDTIGMPLVLLITGVILLAVAFMTMRLRSAPPGLPGHHPPAAPAA